MKLTLTDLHQKISDCSWDAQQLADALSAIGHETEVVNDQTVDITLTTNRADCKELDTLLFDLAGVSNLTFTGTKPDTTAAKTVTITIDEVNKILGTQLEADALNWLTRLGFTVKSSGVGVPAYRTDIAGVSDIAEEVARLYGFNNIKPVELSHETAPASDSYYKTLSVKKALAEAGLTETLTYTFTSEQNSWQLDKPHNNDEPYLRSSLLYGLLKTMAKNPYIKRGGFFEVGQVFLNQELEYVGVVIFGYKDAGREMLLQKAEQAIQSTEKIEIIQIDQAVLDKYDVKQSHVYFFETATKSSTQSTEPFALNYDLHPIKPISKFPPTVRDFTVPGITAEKAGEITKLAIKQFPELLIAELVDSYTNPQTNELSVTFRFIFQKMETSFTDEEINAFSQRLAGFLKPYGAGTIQ